MEGRKALTWLITGMLASLLSPIAGSPTCPCVTDPTDQYYGQLSALTAQGGALNLTLNDTSLQTALNDKRTEGFDISSLASADSISTCDDHCRDSSLSYLNLDIGSEILCTWTYECDYDPQRLPAFMYHANCSTEWHLDLTNPLKPRKCQPVNYPILVLRTTGCDQFDKNGEWTWEQESVTVGCTASRNISS